MVSFSCEACNDTLKKPKLDSHAQKCRTARFTCLDCNVTFYGTDYRKHTSCISEDQKYHKSVYKAPKGKGPKQAQNKEESTPVAATTPVESAPAAEPVAPLTTEGVHPDRQKMLDAMNPGQKRKRDAPTTPKSTPAADPTASTSTPAPAEGEAAAAAVVVAKPVKIIPAWKQAQIEKKAAKKLLKQQKREKKEAAKHPATEEERAAKKARKEAKYGPRGGKKEKIPKGGSGANGVAVPQAPEVIPEPTGPFESLPAYLNALLPSLLQVAKPLGELKQQVIEKAAANGFKDEAQVGQAFDKGVTLGGQEKKKRLVVKFD